MGADPDRDNVPGVALYAMDSGRHGVGWMEEQERGGSLCGTPGRLLL